MYQLENLVFSTSFYHYILSLGLIWTINNNLEIIINYY